MRVISPRDKLLSDTNSEDRYAKTLLIQGESDIITSAAATREMHHKLVECGVPAVNIIYPLTNHAFDILTPQVSPLMRHSMTWSAFWR